YAKEQGMWHDPEVEPEYSERLELDLSTVVPSIAGPKRPQDRISLDRAKKVFRRALMAYADAPAGYDQAVEETFPASDVPSFSDTQSKAEPPAGQVGEGQSVSGSLGYDPVPITFEDGQTADITHGAVVIAAITSCTNTSNPNVMMAAALLAKNAVERGLKRKPWVKTSLAPGSRVVTDYFERAGVTK